MTFSITILNIIKFSIMTSSIKGLFVTLIINDIQYIMKLSIMVLDIEYCYNECRYADCHDLFMIVLNVIMLSVVMLGVVMLYVVAPYFWQPCK
jgi:hypothetical protein